jgi:eukaryotic-like serine/threonine-protein kinase
MTDFIGTRLGQYEVTGMIGRGGMATVYKAKQLSMDRDVAIKVIGAQLVDDPGFVARFEHEARLIARLQHVHILPVYDFGREGDLLYLAMRLVDGGSLDSQLRRGALPLDRAARLFTQIASALSYAHREGVIHRDLKPNNILLDKNGDPYLTDFGIAKMIHHDGPALTATGIAMGTPSYMAPEQWRGMDIDARADIYALGIMLYEMLTGKLPFQGDTPYILMYKHFDELPPRPGTLNPDLPPEIDLITRRAMAKDREDRFASANEMADVLNTVVSGGVVSNLPTFSTVAFSGEAEKARTGQPAPTSRRDDAQSASVSASPALPAATAPVVSPYRKRLPLFIGLAIVVLLLIGAGVFFSSRPAYRPLLNFDRHTAGVRSVSWSPDGNKLASAGEDALIRIWNPTTGESLGELRGHLQIITVVRWSPDGSKLASASEDGTMRIWNPESGLTIATLTLNDPLKAGYFLAWSPDGARIVGGYIDGKVRIWDVAKGEVVATYDAGTALGEFLPVAWSPDGKRVASAAKDNSVQIWDVETGQSLATFVAHTGFITSLAWNRDGSRLASASIDHQVRTWDMVPKQPVPLLTINNAHVGGVSYAAWSPDSKQLVTSGGFINLGSANDLTARIWNAETGQPIHVIEGHTQPVREAFWSPDTSKLATAGLDNTVRIWGR